MPDLTNPSALLRSLFETAIDAANPIRAVGANLPSPPRGRTVVIGAGKASIQMAMAVEAAWKGPLAGFVVAPHGYPSSLKHIEALFGGHPVPDEGSLAAAERALALAGTLKPDDLLIALISGGGSALMTKPAPGLSMADKLAVTSALLKSGANIAELNCVRKHLSAVKGGRLAAAADGARIHTLILSDVPRDDPTIVASGPTVPDPTTKADALEIVQRYRIALPASVRQWLESADDAKPVTAANNDIRVIVSPEVSFQSAIARAKESGLEVLYLGDRIEGEAREVAKVHAALALHIRQRNAPVRKPCLILSGGETGVTVRGDGRGGRNVEFALALAIALAGEKGIHALAGDTDGVDGLEKVAGAIVTPDTLERARNRGLDPMAYLERNDAHSFFEKLGDQVITGPTQTNVNDFRAILIEA
ncbi:MAG: glycerate kinase [Rhizobiales bacterium]|nr:glycerate kinase [Hyphomicrobiales bacterium]